MSSEACCTLQLMTHLVNHMSHFPMGSGAARLHTTVQEHHDLPEYIEDDLRPEIFNAPNVQVSVGEWLHICTTCNTFLILCQCVLLIVWMCIFSCVFNIWCNFNLYFILCSLGSLSVLLRVCTLMRFKHFCGILPWQRWLGHLWIDPCAMKVIFWLIKKWLNFDLILFVSKLLW